MQPENILTKTVWRFFAIHVKNNCSAGFYCIAVAIQPFKPDNFAIFPLVKASGEIL